MLIVFANNDGIEISLADSSVAPLPFVGSYRHVNGTSRYDPRPFGGVTNGVTAVEMIGGDGDGDAKVVDYCTVKNPNAANETVIISHRIGGTAYETHRVTLAQHERLEYQDGLGWSVYASTGAIKTSINQGANAVSSNDEMAVLAADVNNSNAVANSIADVTGLQFPVVNGLRYYFEFRIRYTAAATATGSRWTVNGPAFSELTYDSDVPLTATTQTNNRSLGAYDLPAASNATSPATTLGNIAWIWGFIRPSADGNVVARFASEVASSAIVAKAGSFVRWRVLA